MILSFSFNFFLLSWILDKQETLRPNPQEQDHPRTSPHSPCTESGTRLHSLLHSDSGMDRAKKASRDEAARPLLPTPKTLYRTDFFDGYQLKPSPAAPSPRTRTLWWMTERYFFEHNLPKWQVGKTPRSSMGSIAFMSLNWAKQSQRYWSGLIREERLPSM